ncbi:RNA polymerase sigma factor [Microtetraspora fusca]|uniref:RNA polymerase sigma factor n=1 Tax=Microtetraspora fusca TaxID=1997 RepID=A0ABW6V275_MICFU
MGRPETRQRFEEIYLAYYADLLAYIRRRVDSHDDAADALAETFATAWRRLPDVPDGHAARLWLYGVARRVLPNGRRTATRRSASGVSRIQGPGECRRPFSFCSIGLRIPVGYRKQVLVFLGRPARAGERYGWMVPIDFPGEPLQCVDFINKTVADVEPMLRARGLKATFTAYGVKEPVPRDWYVYDGVLTAPGEALMAVNRVPNPTPRPKKAFCPDGR